jgi:hypothetical protein
VIGARSVLQPASARAMHNVSGSLCSMPRSWRGRLSLVQRRGQAM